MSQNLFDASQAVEQCIAVQVHCAGCLAEIAITMEVLLQSLNECAILTSIVFEQWTKPFICCFSDGDPITRGFDRVIHRRVPGAQGQPHATLRGGHFLQEDDAQTFARMTVAAAHAGRARQ